MRSTPRCPDYEMQLAKKRHIDFLAHCRSARAVSMAWIQFQKAVARFSRKELPKAFRDNVSAIDSLHRVLVNLEQIHCEIYYLLKGMPVHDSEIPCVVERPDWLPDPGAPADPSAPPAKPRPRRRADKA